MFGMGSGPELLIVALVVLLLFGGKKIPELAKGLGGGIRNFKKALKEEDEVSDKKEIEAKEDTATKTSTQESQKA